MKRTTSTKRFNNPFQAAADKLGPLVAHSPAPAKPASQTRDERRLFADEMSGVKPLGTDGSGRVGAPAPKAGLSRRQADDLEAYAELGDLVDGQGSFDLTDSDEFIEGIACGIDKRCLRRLRKGDFSVEDHLDLHGQTRAEAQSSVERFLTASRHSGKRCVLVVHGRGLHSKDDVPVLKDSIRRWLGRGRIARAVLAFCSARPCDGGVGAVYVLLRR